MHSFLNAKVMEKTLRHMLSERGLTLSHSESLEIVAKQFGVPNWNVLAARIEKPNADTPELKKPEAYKQIRKLFSVELPGAVSVKPDVYIVHPFPQELQVIKELKSFGEAWNKECISTRERPFVPPLPPEDCFGVERVELNLFKDWNNDDKIDGVLQEGVCAIILSDTRNNTVGYARWRWWGFPGVAGINYTFCFKTEKEFIEVDMDIRPYMNGLIRGPQISVLSCSQVETEIEIIKQIKRNKERYRFPKR